MTRKARSIGRRLSASVGLGTVAVTTLTLLPVSAHAADAPVSTDAFERSAAVVEAEDRRVTQLRTLTSLARWQGSSWETPYRVSTATGYTLVLTQRAQPYTVQDLLNLAPQTFLKLSDGSYLLTEHVVVAPGATLRLQAPGGLDLRLASSSRGFVSIVSLGGRLQFAGEQGAEIRVSSWDPDAGEPDRDPDDGRAYVRAVGGEFETDHAEFSDLGFWSGRTGGVALTGSDRPAVGRIGNGVDSGEESLLHDVQMQDAGPLAPGQSNPNIDVDLPADDQVVSRIADTSFVDNAFGLFVTGASSFAIVDSSVTGSSIAGIVLHRYVTNGTISGTTSSDNLGDGISLDRATTNISILDATVTGNSGNGLSMNGTPLAEGPSATGATTVSYGANSVSNSTFEDNGNYGIDVRGGTGVDVANNEVTGNSMGIVVHENAERVSVTGNQVSGSDRHGIAFTDGVQDSLATGNVVSGAATGLYLRDSSVEVRGNTVEDATVHGVSLVGEVAGSVVSLNVLAGAGASAFDDHRASGEVTAEHNATENWTDTSPWYLWLKRLLQPMTALWVLILALIAVSAVRARGRERSVAHPYAHQMAHHGHLPVPAPGHIVDLRDGQLAAPLDAPTAGIR